MALRLVLNKAPARGKITSARLSATVGGQGDNPLTAEAQEVTIKFYEVPARRDAATEPRLLGSLTAQARMDGALPRFELGFPIDDDLAETVTDYRLRLTFDGRTVFPSEGLEDYYSLGLPWDSQTDERNTMEVAGTVEIGGAAISEPGLNGSVDVAMQHTNVAEPDSGSRYTYYGAYRLYPDANQHLSNRQRIPIGTDAIAIHCHESVAQAADRVHSGSFDEAALRGMLQDIFRSGGLNNLTLASADSEQARASGYWARRAGSWVGAGLASRDAVFEGVTDDEGVDVPFFEYWVFAQSVDAVSGEVADAEVLNPNSRTAVDVSGRTKKVLIPLSIVRSTWDRVYGEARSGPHRMQFLANVIAHEIGHSLGLIHAVRYNGENYAKTGGLGVMTNLEIDGGAVVPNRFSPPERIVLQRHFL
jgi:Metallo-peptidase family M12B Reprolysin-like